MKYTLIEKFKNKAYLKKDSSRVYISRNLINELKRIQLKMDSEYKKRNKRKFKFNTLRASDYIAEIIKEHRRK